MGNNFCDQCHGSLPPDAAPGAENGERIEHREHFIDRGENWVSRLEQLLHEQIRARRISQAVREEVRPRGIRVLNIYLAATNTEIWNTMQGDWPREKMLLPEEIADAVAYALSRPADVAVENIDLLNLTGRLYTGFVIGDEPETPLDESGVIFV
jgi:hypothetical protein